MDNKTRKIKTIFQNGKQREVLPASCQNWLLVSASVVVFFVLPTLLTWSLSGTIHARSYEQLSPIEGTVNHFPIPLK